jgi:Fic family protein
MSYGPPFEITSGMVNRISSIAELLGRLDSQGLNLSPQLRKQNRIRTIQGTLAIEGNTLSLEQVTAIVEGKRVLGAQREISEVLGAIRAYEALPDWDPGLSKDFLRAHHCLMSDVLIDAGKFRKGGVGIHKGDRVIHVAPPAGRVPELMADLLDWVKSSPEHALIKSCVFHYELEFIHPFMDGNGRMGRLWQTLILGKWNGLFYLLPIESLIKDQQERYYRVLEECDRNASSTVFIDFMLEVIETVMLQNSTVRQGQSDQATDQATDQVKRLLAVMDDGGYWTAQDLMARLSLSHRPTFRKNYLNPALQADLLVMQYPEMPRSPKQRYRKRS